ncbi:MAG TPA: DUF4347 domain-containing protein, partial [Xanthobacteraceae bacterium]|nr:DUF4347 domain-containing protein [Xanthobacteraceae bacterium]
MVNPVIDIDTSTVAATATGINDATVTRTAAVRRIIFIDPAVPGAQALLAGVAPDAVAILLDPDKDGVQQIADVLAANELSDLAAIQIVSHGSEGSITLGSTVLDNGNVVSFADALAQIGAALASGGDIMLYGCDVAGGSSGQQFIDALASLTAADVAASTDLTGAAALGGDWILEAATGPIEAAPAFTAEAESNFNGLLGAVVANEIISVSSAGVQANAVSSTGSGGTQTAATNNIATDTNQLIGSLSGDGRYVAFVSDANTLAVDGNALRDVFLRDRVTATTTLVSVGLNGAAADGPSFTASVSDDGNLVVFTSNATNLVAGDIVNTRPDIYLRDISAGTTEKISVGVASGDSLNGSGHGVISGNGLFVVFESADQLLASDQNGQPDVYLRDLTTDTTTRISTANSATPQFGGGGLAPDISTDGRWVVFESAANDLVTGDTNSAFEIFRYDRQTGTIIRVSLTDTEGQANGASTVASVSDDGNIIAFLSTASNLVANDPNGSTADVFVRNVSAGTTVRISSLPSGPVSQYPSVSGDGRYVAFLQNNQILIHDLQTGLTQSEPFTTSGTLTTVVNGRPLISADGTTVVFQSTVTNLVASDTNGVQDVFVTPAFWPPLPGRPIFGNEFGGTHPDADLFDFLGPISNDVNLDLLTLTVTNVINGAAERLKINGTLIDLVNSADVSAGSGLLVDVALSGTTASVTIKTPVAGITAAQLQALVDGLIYQNASSAPGPLPRIVTLTGISEVGDATIQALSVAATVSPPRVTELVSISSDGVQANNGANPLFQSATNTFGVTTGNELARTISSDGRYIVFQSNASTLVANDMNAGPNGLGQDVFRHDMLTGETIRVSVANDGSDPNGLSTNASISADGNRVLFMSDATNLLPTADPFGRDLFIRDISAGTTTKVSLTDAGTEIAGGPSIDISEISGDGTAVSFATFTQGFVAADTDSLVDIYVRLLAGNTLLGTGGLPAGPTTVRVSVADNEAAPNGNSNSPSISATGRFVAFSSLASNLVGTAFGSEGGDDTNGLQDIFVRDLVAGTTKRVNLVEAGATDTQAATGISFAPALSADGNLIVFASTSQLTASDTDSNTDVYLRNIGTTTVNGIAPGTTILVSGSPLVTLGTSANTTPTISPDGKHVAFINTNNTSLWVYDVLTGVTGRAVSTASGAAIGTIGTAVGAASLANDSIAFQSGSPFLVPNDIGGSTQDVFWAPVETLVLGGTIWNDNGTGGGIASNGIKDGTEPGIANVTLALFSDANNDNVADNLLSPIQVTTTSATGDYQFTGLAPGNYIVRVNQTNFDAGGALVLTPLSPVTVPEPLDPDNDVDNDDNGARVAGQPAFSNSITLAYGMEPINDGDTIADTNFTLDFGFLGNPPPQILNLGGDTATFTEEGPAVLLDDSSAPKVAATVTDDQTSLNGGNLTVAITVNKVAAQDVLGITTAGTVSLSSGTSVGSIVSVGGTAVGTIAAGGTGIGTDNLIITFNANATPALVGTLIQALTYSNTNTADPSISPRTIAVSVSDGLGGTDSENVTVNITQVNDAPVATTPVAHYTVNEQTALNLHGTGLAVSDVDGNAGSETVTLSVGEGTITLAAGNSGVTGITGGGTNSVTFSGTIAQLNALLSGSSTGTLVYIDNTDTPSSSTTLTLLIHDNGNTPSGDLTDSDTATIDITAVNDAPTALMTTDPYTATEQTGLSLKGTGMSVADVDSLGGVATVTLSVGEGALTVVEGDSGVTVVSGNGTSSVVVSGTLAQLNALLAAGGTSNLTYIDNNDNPAASTTLTLQIDDGGNTGSGGAQTG